MVNIRDVNVSYSMKRSLLEFWRLGLLVLTGFNVWRQSLTSTNADR